MEWVCGDALRVPFPARSFDLLSMQYPALPKAADEAPVRTLLVAAAEHEVPHSAGGSRQVPATNQIQPMVIGREPAASQPSE